jgi:hypothetical protein
MRYWAYLLGKLVAAAALSQGLYLALYRLLPKGQPEFGQVYPPRFAHDLGYTLALGLWFLLSCGMLYLAVWDQRYRCRVCLRRLRMPVETGSWSRMLQFGRPEIEYICTYGHGRLNVSEVQISGSQNPEWTPQTNDYWAELTSAGQPNSKEDHPD